MRFFLYILAITDLAHADLVHANIFQTRNGCIIGCCKEIDFSKYKADQWFMGGNRQVFNINGTFRP